MLQNTKIIFFGAGPHVISILGMLRNHYDVPLVVTTERYDDMNHYSEKTHPLITYCGKNNIKFLSVSELGDTVLHDISIYHVQIGVLAYFGLLLPENILNAFPLGIINTHPSLLPTYRGPTPVQTAILNGDLETGVTIIKLDNEVDHGPILAQEKVQIEPDDTAEDLYARLFKKGGEILLEALPKYVKGEIELKEQDHSIATVTSHLSRTDGKIDADNPPSPEIIDRMTRAYWPWPGVWTQLRQGSAGQAELRVKFLPNGMIQVEGKKPVNLKDFINGYPSVKDRILQILPIVGIDDGN